MNGYAPRTGSTGERAMTYLMENGRTLKSILATELDAEPSTLDANLNLCVANGIINREVEGGNTYYALAEVKLEEESAPSLEIPQFVPNGSVPSVHSKRPASVFDGPAELEPFKDEKPDIVLTQSIQANSVAAAQAAAASMQRAIANGAEFARPNPIATAENPRNKRQFSVGIFSDGRLEIVRTNGDYMELEREELETMCAFLEKIGSIRA